MHAYTPYGIKYYEPILDFFLKSMKKYEQEYDKLYIIEDSNWEIEESLGDIRILDEVKGEIIRVNPSLRYYDAYKSVLPQIKEDAVLFLDNDVVIYKQGVIFNAFAQLQRYAVVSIYDDIGSFHSPLLNGKSKFCPYFFCTTVNLLNEFKEFEWGPVLWGETLSELTIAILAKGYKPFEIEEDKTNIYFDGTQDGEKGKNLGYMHIRAGSTPAYLLATKKYGNIETYNEYLKNQPKNEYLRQMAWYYIMSDKAKYYIATLLMDMNITSKQWIDEYIPKFRKFHGL